MKPNNIDTKELQLTPTISCPLKTHQKRCDDQKKRLLREYILERGQNFGRIRFRNTWGHQIYTRIGGDNLFLDLPEDGIADY